MNSVKINFKAAAVLFLFLGFAVSYAQDLKPIKLLSPEKGIGKPLMEALNLRSSNRNFDTKLLPMQELSNLLWAAFGINRPESGKRTAPSAMNWQEVDIYVTMAEGAFIYDAVEHQLNPVSKEDLRGLTGVQAFVKTAPINLVYVSDMKKVSRAGADDAAIWTGADCGFIAQNVYLYCASQGLAVVVRGMVDKTKLAQALHLRPEQKIMLCQTIGYAK